MPVSRGRKRYGCRFCGYDRADTWGQLKLHLATAHPDVEVVEPMVDARPLWGIAYDTYGNGVNYVWAATKVRHRGAV